MAADKADIFTTKVVPIMNKVRSDLNAKCAKEIEEKQSSMAYLFSGAAGPDGGMAAQSAAIDSLQYTGKWNSKTVEDYIAMVKSELKKKGITVTADIEKKMIDKMINEQVPKSSIEYIMKKAATSSLFYLPQAVHTSPMQAAINKEAERRYNPSSLEKGTGWVLGSAADYLTTAGVGGSWSTAAKFIGTDIALNVAADKLVSDDDVPLVIDPKYKEQYKADQQKQKEQTQKQKPTNSTTSTSNSTIAEAEETPVAESTATTTDNKQEVSESIAQGEDNYGGWDSLLGSLGLDGMGDTVNHLGFTLSMLPEMLLGVFTGKTTSVGMNKGTLFPLVAIIAGSFFKNPMLKLPLMLWGGANLVNKMSQEALTEHRQENGLTEQPQQSKVQYKRYEDEQLNARIKDPRIEGNVILMDIDNIPRVVTLPPTVAAAYKAGALPLNKLANAILAKNDQKGTDQQLQQESQTVTRHFEQKQEREQVRGIR